MVTIGTGVIDVLTSIHKQRDPATPIGGGFQINMNTVFTSCQLLRGFSIKIITIIIEMKIDIILQSVLRYHMVSEF